jgi:hypothetical protein
LKSSPVISSDYPQARVETHLEELAPLCAEVSISIDGKAHGAKMSSTRGYGEQSNMKKSICMPIRIFRNLVLLSANILPSTTPKGLIHEVMKFKLGARGFCEDQKNQSEVSNYQGIILLHQSIIAPDLLLNDQLSQKQLTESLMCINGMKLLQYIQDIGGVTLTNAGFFNRKCVTWAAEEFHWPGYQPEKLYRINRVLNERDVLPLTMMHDLLVGAKLLRHSKGKSVLSRKGRELLGNHGALQAILFETWFTHYNFNTHPNILAPEFEQLVDYRHFIGVASNRTQNWVTLNRFTGWCLPMDWIDHKLIAPAHDAWIFIYIRLIRPLQWLGLIEIIDDNLREPLEKQELRKTSLFDQFLKFSNINLKRERTGPLH